MLRVILKCSTQCNPGRIGKVMPNVHSILHFKTYINAVEVHKVLNKKISSQNVAYKEVK